TEYNQLFYLIKYNKVLNLNLNVFINGIKNRFNQDVSNLFKILIESDNTFFNLFKANNEFNSLEIYPNEYIVEENKPIVLEDADFIKQKLLMFEGNYVYYLKSSGSYSQIDISVLQKIDPKIQDKDTYVNYINSLSKTYKSTSQFLNLLKSEIPNIINYSLSNNYINLDSIYNLYKFISYSNINYSEIFMSLISFINIANSVLFFVNLKEKKND
ncbi:MAG: hypothetical protein K2K73_01350, partial [Ureaplasma sp.]|nr:hypothetical protein [Ureaplasma sp.]